MSRCIDADALKEAFEEVYPLATNEMGGAVNKRIYDIIDNAPTVEERPKGKWIEVDNGLVSGRCSLCGWEAVIMETDVCGMPFCPNCGADMRSVDEDLCETCKHGDNCERSDKGVSFAKHSVCWKYER